MRIALSVEGRLSGMFDTDKKEVIIREFERFLQEYNRDVGFTSYDEEVLNGVHLILIEQRPRVMTPDAIEMQGDDDDVLYLEIRGISQLFEARYACMKCHKKLFGWDENFCFVVMGRDNTITFSAKTYNDTWRCWTSKPSEKLRSETEWAKR